MLSEEQKKRKILNILNVTRAFLDSCGSMKEVANETGISESSAQRYLHDPVIITLFSQDIYDEIQTILAEKIKSRAEYAGFVSAEKNAFSKDELGRFTGSKPKR